MPFEISSGKIMKAKKVVIYGPEGIGKSTFAAQFPDPLFIDTEGSTNSMDVRRFPRPTSWTMLGEELQQVILQRPCSTLIVDTVDWAESLCIEHICAKNGKNGIEDFGWGNGYVYEKEEFAKFLSRLEEVIEVGINVVLTAHAQLRKFSQPDEVGEYDRWELKLGKKTGSVISPLVKEWADMLLFANYKTFAVAVDKDGKKFKGQGGGRIMYTQHHPCWDAKNRYGLSPELPFEYNSISHLFDVSSKTVSVPDNKYWYEPGTNNLAISPDSPGATYIDVPKEEYVKMEAVKKGLESQEKTTVAAEPEPPVESAETEDIPKELLDLMRNAEITEDEIRHAVSLKGYYPEDTPISSYDSGFVSGVLIGAWDKIKAFILDKREPF